MLKATSPSTPCWLYVIGEGLTSVRGVSDPRSFSDCSRLGQGGSLIPGVEGVT